jgi:hypothetical protein
MPIGVTAGSIETLEIEHRDKTGKLIKKVRIKNGVEEEIWP